jgi:hypothetical protein
MTEAHCDKFNIHSRKQMQDYARTQCRALHLCRQVATASKHYTVDKFPDPNVEITVTLNSIPEPEPTPFKVHVAPGCFVYFFDGDHKREAEDVVDEALRFWTEFIYGNAIAK